MIMKKVNAILKCISPKISKSMQHSDGTWGNWGWILKDLFGKISARIVFRYFKSSQNRRLQWLFSDFVGLQVSKMRGCRRLPGVQLQTRQLTAHKLGGAKHKYTNTRITNTEIQKYLVKYTQCHFHFLECCFGSMDMIPLDFGFGTKLASLAKTDHLPCVAWVTVYHQSFQLCLFFFEALIPPTSCWWQRPGGKKQLNPDTAKLMSRKTGSCVRTLPRCKVA